MLYENRKQEKIYCGTDDDPMYNYAVSTENIGSRGRFTARDSARSKRAGMNAHLAKPLDVNKLIDTLKKCLAENSELKLREDL